MSASGDSHVHLFECRLLWTGAERGPIRDYASYSREHRIEVRGKPPLGASSAAVFRGDDTLHNPEDLLVASLAGCHFLSYAAVCARARVEVLAYEDAATGRMAFDRERRVMRFQEVVLHPRVTIARAEDREKALALHEQAHHDCFIANSVSFEVRNEPTIVVAGGGGGEAAVAAK